MEIVKTSFEACVHHVCAAIAKNTVQGFRGRSVASLLTAPLALVAGRVVAVAASAFWVVTQTVMVLPDIIGLSTSLASSSQAGLTVSFFKKSATVYGLYFKTMSAQLALTAASCLVPELTHYKLKLHKSLYSLQLQTFIQTLSDFPHVGKYIRKTFPSIDSLVTLCMRLGISDAEWKSALIANIKEEYKNNPMVGYQYLTTHTDRFQEMFKKTIISLAAVKLDALQANGTFHLHFVTGLDPIIWEAFADHLQDATKLRLIELLKKDIVDLEVNKTFLFLHTLYTKMHFRSLRSTQVLRNLLEHMKNARSDLIKRGVFSAEDIASQYGPSHDAVNKLGLLRFFEQATITEGDNPQITFGKAVLTEGHHFFGKKERFVEVKRMVDFTKEESEAIVQHIIGNEKVVLSPLALETYRILCAFYGELAVRMNNDHIEDKRQVPWAQAFIADLLAVVDELMAKKKNNATTAVDWLMEKTPTEADIVLQHELSLLQARQAASRAGIPLPILQARIASLSHTLAGADPEEKPILESQISDLKKILAAQKPPLTPQEMKRLSELALQVEALEQAKPVTVALMIDYLQANKLIDSGLPNWWQPYFSQDPAHEKCALTRQGAIKLIALLGY